MSHQNQQVNQWRIKLIYLFSSQSPHTSLSIDGEMYWAISANNKISWKLYTGEIKLQAWSEHCNVRPRCNFITAVVKTSQLPSIEDWGQTYLFLVLTFRFDPLWAMVVTHTHAKDQGQRSVSSKDRVETDGQRDGRADRQMTDGCNCITSCANTVSKKHTMSADFNNIPRS